MCRRSGIFQRSGAAAAVAVSALFLVNLMGCSVFMAAKQPEKKDLTVLEPGTPRDLVLGELGTPFRSEVEGGKKVDYYMFTQGYSSGAKTARAVFHGTADVLTIGLWELVATPTESVFDGTEVTLKVNFDHADKVESVVPLKGEKVLKKKTPLWKRVSSSLRGSGGEETPPATTTRTAPSPEPATTARTSPSPQPATVAMAPTPPGGSLAPIPDVNFGRYHALVIGNNEYRHMKKLRVAKRDARSVAELLEKSYGFRVVLLEDATRSEILGELGRMRRDLGPGDNLLIFYAGHGWLDTEANEGFWLPVDAEQNNVANWIANADISRTLKAMDAKHVMVVADSCFSGKILRSVQVTVHSHGYLARMAEKRARVALASGGLEPVEDSGGEDRHSPFTAAFLEALTENESVMDGTQLFEKIRGPVVLASDQTPEYADIRQAGHDGGDFLFVRSDWLAAKSP